MDISFWIEDPPVIESIALSIGTLDPEFDSETLAYSSNLPSGAAEVTVTVTADLGASLTLNGQAISSGEASPSLPVTTGSNEISVVSIYRGVPTPYTITVNRASQSGSGIGTLANVSTRGQVLTGEFILIGGFIIQGTGTKKVLIRGIGPALTGFGVDGALADPTIEVFRSATPGAPALAANDNWKQNSNAAAITAAAERVGAFALPEAGSTDAALLLDLEPGGYTVQLKGQESGTGIGLFEAYDANETPPASAGLFNVSTRGTIGSASAVSIAGFVVTGNQPRKVLVRGVGPTLWTFGVQGVIEDPILELQKSNPDGSTTVIASNDNWESAPNLDDLKSGTATVGAFALQTGAKDAAVYVELQPGNYTAHIGGNNGSTGVALTEVFIIPNE